ncbi:hypothetical protein [Desulforamulus reducens]|uniref:hypothetical protein n=1 Tax=Desulforamulus reducens TaxID=59610 RepID=UPI00031A5DE6|nr:hypothetical protein [Desulforamulus reducens]
MTDLNIQFTCPDCDHSFFLDSEEILESEFLKCPSCGCALSEEELRHLRIAINYMKEKSTH